MPGVAGRSGFIWYFPSTTSMSGKLSASAPVRMRHSCSPGFGVGTSRSFKTSRGTPKVSNCQARMREYLAELQRFPRLHVALDAAEEDRPALEVVRVAGISVFDL